MLLLETRLMRPVRVNQNNELRNAKTLHSTEEEEIIVGRFVIMNDIMLQTFHITVISAIVLYKKCILCSFKIKEATREM